MFLQCTGTGTILPSIGGFVTPFWESLAKAWDAFPDPSSATATLGPTTVEFSHDNYETDSASLDLDNHQFGWHLRRKVEVGTYCIEWRPVTNGQFYEYWKVAEGKVSMLKSWVNQNGHVMVSNWPMSNRHHAQMLRRSANTYQICTLFGAVPMKIGHRWPVITDFDSISTYATACSRHIPTEAKLQLFYDKFECGYEGGSNLGFCNWHPVP